MSDLRWYVLRSNPNCEDRAQASLEAAGFVSFIPKYRRERRHKRTKEWLIKEYPLFSRYLFLGLEPGREHWGQVRKCDGVESAVNINGTPLRVSAHEIQQVIDAQATGEFDDLRRSSVKRPHAAGDLIYIESGPFAGFHANVTSLKGKRAIEVMIQIFGRETAVSLEEKQVRAA
ncbi:transcription termination/antitermination protein NusG [Aureimonas glaciei]|uniref:Transcription termination/antitermination protein NusG n=1 Tax=Aureimonas glaciei TaxID=1776957 RepID=A0A916Y4F8_9HYPH|nr:transcription termination/antitermination NusG family protein [Aureimonas glaciei]GGD30883.1 transcription termination/antitermination protein NusG [Aureimonas glaciei]